MSNESKNEPRLTVPIMVRPEDKEVFERDRAAAGSMPQWSWFRLNYRKSHIEAAPDRAGKENGT